LRRGAALRAATLLALFRPLRVAAWTFFGVDRRLAGVRPTFRHSLQLAIDAPSASTRNFAQTTSSATII